MSRIHGAQGSILIDNVETHLEDWWLIFNAVGVNSTDTHLWVTPAVNVIVPKPMKLFPHREDHSHYFAGTLLPDNRVINCTEYPPREATTRGHAAAE